MEQLGRDRRGLSSLERRQEAGVLRSPAAVGTRLRPPPFGRPERGSASGRKRTNVSPTKPHPRQYPRHGPQQDRLGAHPAPGERGKRAFRPRAGSPGRPRRRAGGGRRSSALRPAGGAAGRPGSDGHRGTDPAGAGGEAGERRPPGSRKVPERPLRRRAVAGLPGNSPRARGGVAAPLHLPFLIPLTSA